MFSPRTSSVAKRVVGSMALTGALLSGGAGLAVVSAVPAAAQTTTKIDPNDFIDPVTGEFDLEAYLAAVEAANASNSGTGGTTTSGTLPFTGSTTEDLLVAGVAVVVTGGAIAAVSARRRSNSASKPPTAVG